MNFYDLHSQIFVHKNNGQIWNFYISNNSLFYRIIVNNTPIKKVKLIDNIKTYDVAMETGDDIDLVCVKNNNELIYFKHSNNSWKRKTFKKTNSKSDIDFVNLLNVKNSIHIFYAFRNHAENKPYKVFHIYSQSNQWKYNYLAPVMITKNIKPYFVDYNRNGEILFLYKFNANTKNRGKIYVKIFDGKRNRWSSAVNLKFQNESTNILNLLIDSKDTIHFVFKENNSVRYLDQRINDFNNMVGSLKLNNKINLGDIVDTDYHIFEVDDNLWISWKSNDKLYHLCPKKQASNLTERELLESDNIFTAKFLGTLYKDKSFSKHLITFGTNINNEIFLLGLDSDFLVRKGMKDNEPKDNVDRAWYGDDEGDEILDLLDEELDESKAGKIENDVFYKDEETNPQSKIREVSLYLDDKLTTEADDLVVEDEIEKDLTFESKRINNVAKIPEPISYLDDESQNEKEADDMNISTSGNMQDQCIIPVEIETSENTDDEIIDENIQKEVNSSTKKSIFKKMKDFLINS
ncbi:hypothetical protein R9X47_03650 [Wukongibacter baidiensis]|uniref:hypothetical protein n=1 Tax=Wukongibacter baidiensis TaxID=1723361 RepID=UPI003D7FBFE9